MAPRTIVLVGLMGAGKTSVGRALAHRLDRAFVDNDRAFERRTGTTASAYARDHGDEAMHAVEREVLAEQVTGPDPVVVAAPGSVALMGADVLAEAFVVFLDVDPEVLAGRVATGDHRPLLDDDPGSVLRRMHDERQAVYRGLADLTVDATGCTVDDLVTRIARGVADEPSS